MPPRAWVLGNLDLVRPLAEAGIACVAVAPPDAPVTSSRHVAGTIPWPHDVPDDQMAARLRRAVAGEPPPALYFGTDRALLLVSRHRDVLAPAFRFVIEDADRVEDLVDKDRFRALAEQWDLPVPPSVTFRPSRDELPADLPYPCLLKPQTRDIGPWVELFQRRKGVLVRDATELELLLPRLVASGQDIVAQAFVPGPESRIESHHAYVSPDGEEFAFTGRKLRTWPLEYGNSTALTTTASSDVRQLGSELVRRLGLRGALKLDFKRDPDGRLWLLEINPRFSLWHHLGARAGVNLPALVHADLCGLPRPEVTRPRAGVQWMHPDDLLAARADPTISRAAWLRFAATCDCRSNLALDDPRPALHGLLRRVRRQPPRTARTPLEVAAAGGASATRRIGGR